MEEPSLAQQHRFDILKSLRDSMLSEMQEFRGAMWKCTIATNAVIVAVVSWLFTKGLTIVPVQQVLLTIGVTAFAGTCCLMVASLKQHFMDHAIVVNEINRLFGAYREGVFRRNDTLFLTKSTWAHFGEKGVTEPIFRSAYISLAAVYAFAVSAIWLGA